MKNKKVIYVTISIVFLILIVTIVVYLFKRNYTKNSSENTNLNNVYTCTKVVLESDYHSVYSIEKIEVKDEIVLKITKFLKRSYKFQDMYNSVKDNQSSEEVLEFDDQTKSVITDKEEIKYDEESNVKYENYKELLITDNFNCE